MKIAKKVKKTFKKATKAVGLNAMERRHAVKTAKAFTYDVGVNVASTICLDVIYTTANVATAGVCAAASKISNLLPKKSTTTVVEIEEDLVEDIEESEV